MTSDIRDFFLQLKNPNYLAMKLLLDVFNRMMISDDVSKNIIDNISVLSQYNIRLVDSNSMFNFVYTEDDLSEVKFAISKASQEEIVCHEFGHLLLDLFFDGNLPEEYIEVNKKAIKRMIENKDNISDMLGSFRDELYQGLIDNVGEAFEFVDRNPEVYQEYIKLNPEAGKEEFIGDVIADYYCFMSNLDRKSSNYNRIGNIIDSMFHGENPFYELYGNEEIFPLIASHDKTYFIKDEHGPEFAGFEEQFAEYLVLRLYGDNMSDVVSTVRMIAGDEWFLMMDKVYEDISLKISEDVKVYQYN